MSNTKAWTHLPLLAPETKPICVYDIGLSHWKQSKIKASRPPPRDYPQTPTDYRQSLKTQ